MKFFFKKALTQKTFEIQKSCDKKLICGTIAAIIGIDRRNNEGEGSSAIRGNRRGKKRVRRYLRHMEDENDCNTSDDELQDNTNSVVSKIFN